MSCPKYKIDIDRVVWTDKEETFSFQFIPEEDEILTPEVGGYTVRVNDIDLVNVATQTNGIITITATVPSGTFEEGFCEDGILFPNTLVGSSYFELTFNFTAVESNS